MTKIGKEKNMSGSRELVLQVKEDGKKIDEVNINLRHLDSRLIGLNVVSLYINDTLDVADKKLKSAGTIIKFLKKHA